MDDIVNFTLGFLLNFVVALIIVRFIYYPRTPGQTLCLHVPRLQHDYLLCAQLDGEHSIGDWRGLWTFCDIFRAALPD
jgi:hypothetical protein